MKEPVELPCLVATRSKPDDDGIPSRIPIKYVEYLLERAASLGYTTDAQLAKALGINKLGIWRLRARDEGTGISMATKIREFLVEKGLEIPQLPIDDMDWDVSSIADRERPPRDDDSDDEKIRRNMIRFRQMLHLDQAAASDHVGVPYEMLVAWERGEATPTGPQLISLARRYFRRRGADDFVSTGEVEPPFQPKLPLVSVSVRGSLNDEGQRRLDAIRAQASELDDPKFRADHNAGVDHVLKVRKSDRTKKL